MCVFHQGVLPPYGLGLFSPPGQMVGAGPGTWGAGGRVNCL